jgi:large subunit ribosomal protein L10
MALLRAQKVALVERLTQELEASRVSIVFAYASLGSKDNLALRDKAFEEQGKIRMLSNNLLRLILKNQKRELEIPPKQLAIAYGFADEVVAAKLLSDFAKETKSLEFVGGWVDGHFLDGQALNLLASLPSKENLQAQVVGRLNGLIQSLVYSLNFPLQQLAYVVSAVGESKK